MKTRLSMTSLWPATTVELDFVEGSSIVELPRWEFRTLSIGARRDEPLRYTRMFEGSVGSSFEGGDEFRFQEGGRRPLVGLTLTVSDAILNGELLSGWLSSRRLEGVLELRGPDAFTIDTTDARSFSPGALLGLVEEAARYPVDPLRCAIAPSFDVLFDSGRYAGWLLHTPVASLDPLSTLPSSAAVTLVGEFMELIDEQAVRRMDMRDELLKRALIGIRTRACAASESSAARRLVEYIDELIDRFYG